MPKRARTLTSQTENLLLFVSAPEPSTLSLAEDSPSSQPTRTLGVQTPKPPKVDQIKSRRLDAQTPRIGRPDAQSPQFDSTEEPRYPSRVQRDRPHVRLERDLLTIVKQECKSVQPKRLKLQDVIEDGLRLWLRERARSRLDAQTPTSSSCSGSSSSLDLEDLDLTTTTTTVDAQTPKRQALPGFAASIEDMPHQSRHPFEVILAYALEANRNQEGIKTPDVFALASYRTGKHDVVIDLWVQRKENQEAEKRQREEAKAERERKERELEERVKRERAERAETGRKPWE